MQLQDGTVRQWDVRDSLCASVLRLQQPATVATWCPGSGILAVGDELGSLTFFDVRKGSLQLACLHKLHHDAVRAIAAPSLGNTQLRKFDRSYPTKGMTAKSYILKGYNVSHCAWGYTCLMHYCRISACLLHIKRAQERIWDAIGSLSCFSEDPVFQIHERTLWVNVIWYSQDALNAFWDPFKVSFNHQCISPIYISGQPFRMSHIAGFVVLSCQILLCRVQHLCS